LRPSVKDVCLERGFWRAFVQFPSLSDANGAGRQRRKGDSSEVAKMLANVEGEMLDDFGVSVILTLVAESN